MKKKFEWTKKQITALKGSIRKWEKIVDGSGNDDGCKNCPCCQMWASNNLCYGCPIAAFSGEESCYNTPYDSLPPSYREDYQTGAKKELNYIRKVLKAGTP